MVESHLLQLLQSNDIFLACKQRILDQVWQKGAVNHRLLSMDFSCHSYFIIHYGMHERVCMGVMCVIC